MDRSELRRPVSWAFLAPLLCALHCMAAPLLVVTVPALAPTPRIEWTFLLASAVLVLVVLLRGVGVHRQGWVWLPAVVGLAVWAASLADWFEPVPEVVTTVIGSVIVAGGLFWNARLVRNRSCDACACPGCESEEGASREAASVQRAPLYDASAAPTSIR